jgi:hypothetical protein
VEQVSVKTREEGRERRLWLRDLGQQVLLRSQADWSTAERRYAGCGRWRRKDSTVELRIGEDGRAGFGGLQVCGSVWSCPQCAAKIRAHRAGEIDEAARAWMAAGKTLLFVTLTVPHDRGQRLAPLFETVVQGFRQLMSGPDWSGRTRQKVRRGLIIDRWREWGLRDRLGYAGLVRSCEVTYGRAGWHPHLHVLLFRGAAERAGSRAWIVAHRSSPDPNSSRTTATARNASATQRYRTPRPPLGYRAPAGTDGFTATTGGSSSAGA